MSKDAAEVMKLTDDFIKQHLLSPVYSNGKGTHYICKCPFCKKEDHLYLQRSTSRTNSRGENISYMWECKRCGENGRIRKLFNALGKLHLINFGKDTKIEERLNLIEKYKKKSISIELDVPDKNPPLGYKRVYENHYLNSRGFTNEQYEMYNVGTTKFGSEYKDYVVALITENGICKGYVGRCTYSNKQLDEYNDCLKESGIKQRKPRYKNSSNTEFGKLLMGIDEITEQTEVVVIVEGFFDKANVDKLLRTYESDTIKVVCSFGKKISIEQITKLAQKGLAIEDILLLYDPDAVEESKRYAFQLSQYFTKVKIGFTKDKDPGDLTYEELDRILDNLEEPLVFSMNKVQKKI